MGEHTDEHSSIDNERKSVNKTHEVRREELLTRKENPDEIKESLCQSSQRKELKSK